MLKTCLWLLLGINQYWAAGSMVWEHESGSGFKASKKMGPRLKVSHPTDWECRETSSGLLGTRRVAYPLHHGG